MTKQRKIETFAVGDLPRRNGESAPDYIRRLQDNRPTPKSFWSYQAPDAPTIDAAIVVGAIKPDTTREQWESLSPRMRRDIVRDAERRLNNHHGKI